MLKVGPVAGVSYARASLDGYTETGDPVLTLSVEDQEDDQLFGSLGVEAQAQFDVGGLSVSPYLTATAEKELDDDPRLIRYAGTAAPNIVNSWVVGGEEVEVYARLTGGVNFAITRTIALQVTGATTIGQEGGDKSVASLGLRVGF